MTFGGAVAKQDNKAISASMSTFSGALMRGRFIAAVMSSWTVTFVKQMQRAIAASMATMAATVMRGRFFAAATAAMAGSVVRNTFQVLTASMSSWAVTFLASHAILKSFAATMSTWAGSVTKQINKIFNAS